MITLISENGPELFDKIKEALIMMIADLAVLLVRWFHYVGNRAASLNRIGIGHE